MSITDEAQLLISCKSTGTATVNQFTDALGRANGASTALMKTLGGLFSTAAVVNFGRNAIRTYSDLEEATSKFYVVFSGLTKQADAEVEKLKQSFGASTLSARSMLSLTGNLLTGWGFGREESLKLSAQVAQLGSDLASFTNYAGGAEGATTAITKAMLGETEMAKMLGISIKTDSEEFKTLKKELMETKGYTDTQAKALAALQIAMEQSKNAMGDFERTQDSIANRTRIVDNAFQELKANVGRGIADAFNDLQGGVLGLVQAYNKLDPAAQDFITQTGAIFTLLMSVKTGMATYNAMQALAAGTESVATGLNNVQKAAGNAAVGIRGMIAAATPILIMSAAIAGVNLLLTIDSKAAERNLKLANDRLETVRGELDAVKQLHADHQNQLTRYDDLSRKQNRTVQEQQEMERTAKALNSAYKGLNLTIATLGNTAQVSTEQQKLMQEQQLLAERKKQYDIMNASKASASAALSAAFTKTRAFGSFTNVMWRGVTGQAEKGELAILERYIDGIESAEDALEAYNYAMKLGYDEVAGHLKEAESHLKNQAQAIKNINELLGEQNELEEKLEQARKLARERADQEFAKKSAELIASAEELQRARFSPEALLSEKLAKIAEPYTGLAETQLLEEQVKDLQLIVTQRMLNRRRGYLSDKENYSKDDIKQVLNDYIEENKLLLKAAKTNKERILIEKDILDLTEKRIKLEHDAELAQIDAMKERQAAQQEWLSNLMTAYGTFRATTQGAVMAGTAEAQRLQSRTFDTPGVTLESILKDTGKATEKIKDAVLQLEAKMSANASDVNRIRQRIEKLEVSGM